MKRRIGYSARGLDIISGGVKTYVYNTIKALLETDTENEFVIFYNKEKFIGTFSQFSHATEVVVPNAPKFIWDHILLPSYLKRYAIDIAFFPKDVIPLVKVCKYIVTEHDLGYFYPGLNAYKGGDTFYMKMMIPYSIRHADHVIAVSYYTRNDIVRQIPGVDVKKISVVYLSSSFEGTLPNKKEGERVRDTYGIGGTRYLFYAGSLSPRKNLERVIQAFCKAAEVIPHSLVITGGKKWKDKSIHQVIQQSRFKDRILLLGHVSDQDIPYLYQEADLFLYVSLFEGFGIPVLEAFQMETPVLTSKITSIPEVAGDAVQYVDPYDAEAIAIGITGIVQERALQKELIEKGKKQLGFFSWKMSALEMQRILSHVNA